MKSRPGRGLGRRPRAMSERAVSFEHLLKLAHQRAVDGKGGLAASVAKLCLDSRSDLSDRELTLTFEILRMLIDKVEVAVRRNISDYLCTRRDVPKDLITFLANDTINVAYPILRSSPLLEDLDLVRLITDQGHDHAMAVATRHDVSEAVSRRLIELDDETVDVTLAKNLSAHIASEDMETLVGRAENCQGLHSPLAHRPDLGEDLARRLYTMVGDVLRRHILATFEIDGTVIAEAVDNSVLDALDSPSPLRDAMQGSWADTHARGGNTPAARLIRSLKSTGTNGAATIFAEHTNLPLKTAHWVFDRGDGQIIAVAMRAVGMDVDGFATVLDHLGKVGPGMELDRMLDYFERIDGKTAAMVVNHWKNRPPS